MQFGFNLPNSGGRAAPQTMGPGARGGGATDELAAASVPGGTKKTPTNKGKAGGRAAFLPERRLGQRPPPPIWVGGESGPSLRRAAKLGDAWYPIGTNNAHLLDSLKRYQAGIERLCQLTEAAGRRRDAVALTYRVKRTGDALPPRASDGERRLFSGSDAEIIGDIR